MGLKNLDVDHIGVVVKSIKDSINIYKAFGYEIDTDIIHVESQKIYCQYLMHNLNKTRIQLIEPIGKDSPVYNALLKGGGINHICYSCKDIEITIEEAVENGCRIVVKPFRGEGVNNRKVAFLYHPALGITEIVEKENK